MLNGPLRVAVLSSRRAPGLSELVSESRASGLTEIVCGVATDEEFEDAALYDEAGIPLLVNPIRAFARGRGRRADDRSIRPEYDRETLALLAPYEPDIVVLSSYLYILTAPMLEAFPGRIVNVHGSDLTRQDPAGRPLYPGLRAVRDAIRAGERETYATAHIVTEEVDAGPPLARSDAYPVAPFVRELLARGRTRAVHAYAHAHQEWMLEAAWGPLLSRAVCLVGEARAFLLETEPPLALPEFR